MLCDWPELQLVLCLFWFHNTLLKTALSTYVVAMTCLFAQCHGYLRSTLLKGLGHAILANFVNCEL